MATATFNFLIRQLVKSSCLFLLLFSTLGAEWNFSYVLTPTKESTSLRLFYKNTSSFDWTSSQITATESGIRFVINLLLRPIENKTDLTFTAQLDDGVKIPLQGRLFTGGEKILIDTPGTEWLILQLNQGKSIQLEIESYKTTIDSSNFSPLWTKAKHLLVNDKIPLGLK